MSLAEPARKPVTPYFSSGPCAKRPGWSLAALEHAVLARSHRSKEGKARLAAVIAQSRAILGIPADYRIAIVPASDTGAVEMAMWSLLGARPVTMLAWEAFGKDWVTDVVKQLKIADCHVREADYGALPSFEDIDPSHDIVFTWNGTTSGVRVPNADFIADTRSGLTICDATSAAFAMDLQWSKLDVTTWSWQKVLGGEGQHGMIVLSPRAVERLTSYSPPWPMPKIFRMTANKVLTEGLFAGETINTPSMLCVEDALDGLKWAAEIGGLPALISRSTANLAVVSEWVAKSDWADFLCQDSAARSCTSICLIIRDDWFQSQALEVQMDLVKQMAALLEKKGVAFDIAHYRSAPPGFRLWGGATVETRDMEAVLPWLDFAFATVKAQESSKAA